MIAGRSSVMPARPVLDFWYEFASTYSYLSAMRIEREAESAGVDVRWRVFLLGPIFAAQGWTTSPFNLYPAKGRYMWRDMEREAASLGLPCRQPDPFPQNGLLPARVALLGESTDWGPAFAQGIFREEFAHGASIAEPATSRRVLADLDLDADAILKAASADPNKAALKAQCDAAHKAGILAPRPSSPRPARCSGATTGWSRRLPGRQGARHPASPPEGGGSATPPLASRLTSAKGLMAEAIAMPNDALTLQLLAWVGDEPRSYVETIEAWMTSCPRLPIFEDALGDGLI